MQNFASGHDGVILSSWQFDDMAIREWGREVTVP
jgi:hypothetical protein